MKTKIAVLLVMTGTVFCFSCGKIIKNEKVEINSFDVMVKNDTVPAVVEVEYDVLIENTCEYVTLIYNGADSIRILSVSENSSYSIEDIDYMSSDNDTNTYEICTQVSGIGDVSKKTIMQLLYLTAGEYVVEINLKNNILRDTIIVYESVNN
jgi:hypothetical protein